MVQNLVKQRARTKIDKNTINPNNSVHNGRWNEGNAVFRFGRAYRQTGFPILLQLYHWASRGYLVF